MKKRILFFVSSILFSFAAHAGSFSGCSVVTIVTSGDQNIHVFFNCTAPFIDPPACATAASYVGFDGSTAAGKHYFSLLSLALALNLKVDGAIDSTCSPYQNNVALLISLRATKQ